MRGQKKPRNARAQLLDARLSNKHYALAMDHAFLTTVGCGLSRFEVGDACAPLAPGMERFYVPTDSLPREIADVSPERSCRSCIAFTDDDGVESTRFEVCWGESRPMLLTHIDMCTTGWVWAQIFYTRFRARGWFFMDTSHRRHNNYLDSFKESQLILVYREMILCASINNSPWKGCGHFCKVEDAAREYFDNASWRDPLFVALYLSSSGISQKGSCLLILAQRRTKNMCGKS